MNIESLPTRNDFHFAEASLAKTGWKWEPCGDHVLVYPSTDHRQVLLSAISYQLMGRWVRPAYARVDLETYVDLRLVSIPLLRFGFSETGSLSLLGAEVDMKQMTICYRVLIPSEADQVELTTGVFSAYLAMDDIRKIITHYHEVSDRSE